VDFLLTKYGNLDECKMMSVFSQNYTTVDGVWKLGDVKERVY
jgi:hypothetical protein